MAYQTKVPVKIPPFADTNMASNLEKVLMPPERWLITAYSIPNVGSGVVVMATQKSLFGPKTRAHVTTNDSQVHIERAPGCDDATFAMIFEAVKTCTELPISQVV